MPNRRLSPKLSDQVWGAPELCYGEFRSCAEHTATLERQGFRVTKDVAGIPTAMMGEAGDSGPVIAILGEYDALPGLSQEAGVAEPRPVSGSGDGHGCGHNLLGSASLLAATAGQMLPSSAASRRTSVSHPRRRISRTADRLYESTAYGVESDGMPCRAKVRSRDIAAPCCRALTAHGGGAVDPATSLHRALRVRSGRSLANAGEVADLQSAR
jgi:hypothetical protein